MRTEKYEVGRSMEKMKFRGQDVTWHETDRGWISRTLTVCAPEVVHECILDWGRRVNN